MPTCTARSSSANPVSPWCASVSACIDSRKRSRNLANPRGARELLVSARKCCHRDSEHLIMRVTEDRYSRDLRRINLAQQLIRHEVRTAAIRLWTGLSGDRVRKLMRSYTATAGEGLRHRGPPPTSIAEFMRP